MDKTTLKRIGQVLADGDRLVSDDWLKLYDFVKHLVEHAGLLDYRDKLKELIAPIAPPTDTAQAETVEASMLTVARGHIGEAWGTKDPHAIVSAIEAVLDYAQGLARPQAPAEVGK